MIRWYTSIISRRSFPEEVTMVRQCSFEEVLQQPGLIDISALRPCSFPGRPATWIRQSEAIYREF